MNNYKCVDTSVYYETGLKITLNKIYDGSTIGESHIRIIDDAGHEEICHIKRFISLEEHRNIILESILK